MSPRGKHIHRLVNGNSSNYKGIICENYITNDVCLGGNEILWGRFALCALADFLCCSGRPAMEYRDTLRIIEGLEI